MRRLYLALALAFALAVFATAPLHAAEGAPQPAFFVLHQEVVRPSMLPAYEQVTKEFISTVQQHHAASPSFSFTCFAGDDFVYTYVTPLKSFADLDAIYAGFQALTTAVGEGKWNDLMKRGGAPAEMIRESIFMEDPSLSYAPAQPRLQPDEARFFHFDLYYLQPGREMEADAVAREIATLFRKKGIPDSYRLFKSVLGGDMPLLIVSIPAKDPVDFATRDAAVRAALGSEGAALFARAFALTRRFDRHDAWLRTDLSLPPAK